MRIETSTIRGVAFDVVIRECTVMDSHGGTLFYVAEIYAQDRTTSLRFLVRRSRLRETAAAIRREVQRDGIRVFRRLAT